MLALHQLEPIVASIKCKLRLLLSFLQVALLIEQTYGTPMPEEYKEYFLSWFNWVLHSRHIAPLLRPIHARLASCIRIVPPPYP